MPLDTNPTKSASRNPDERRFTERRAHPAEHIHGGVKWDATINLGHILTFIGFMLAGFTAWSTLDKRVTVIEERASLQAVVDRNQDMLLTSNQSSIKESLQEIKSQMNRLNERLERK